MSFKRFAALALAAVTALALCGCGGKGDGKHAAMAIWPAQLSEEETALTELLAIGMDGCRIFDFQMGDKPNGVQSIRLRGYELADGDWNCVTDCIGPFTDATGRLALTFGKMTDGVRMAYQSENNSVGRNFTMEAEDASGLTFATSALSGSPSMEFDQEVPLVLQIATSKSEFSSYDVDYFGMPRELAKHGYEHVYAITVTFSKKTAAELIQAAAPGVPAPDPAQSAPAE